MPANTGNFGALLAPGLRDIFGDHYTDFAEEYSRYFNVVGSTRNYEEDHGLTTLGLVPTKKQGYGVTYDTVFDGLTKRYTHVTYGLGFIITRELYDDILYTNTIIKKMPAGLARSVRYTIEVLGANVLNNAFSGSYVGADSVALCSTAHPLILGGTFANRAATDADLDITSFENALIDIQTNWVDDRGLKVRALPKKVIVHPNDQFQIAMILKSAQLPDTNYNNINPVANVTVEPVIGNFLTDSDAWFVTTDVPDGLTFFWRRRPEFTQDTDFDSENAKYKTTFRCSMGWTDPRGIWGTSGA